jgi:hypothetical protein
MTAMEKTQEQLNSDQVRGIADNIENGITYEEGSDGYDPDYPEQLMSGFDYLSDVYDIEYIVNGEGEFKSARILVAFGGPNIWIDFQTKSVELYWWGDRATAYFSDDAMGVEEALRELWECRS